MVDSADLNLDALATGLPAVTAAFGAALGEAAMVCLDSQGHRSGVEIVVEGDFSACFRVGWSMAVTEQVRRCWNDLPYATEQGAYGLAFLIVQELTGYAVIERSIKGTGFDYWLGEALPISQLAFERKVRLEVSGILQGQESRIRARVKEKIEQTQQYGSRLPAYVVVIEFGQPQARMVQR
ncbi:MAG: hypothetical protein RLZZ511_2775 [Cyanobacteriota bacterium]|jgi:hypothetical protein